jgi:hypothetical protein
MNKFEIVEEAFRKVDGYISGKAVWNWIETEICEQGHDGECILYDKLRIGNNYSNVTYEIEVKRDYDKEEDLDNTDIKLISIRVEGDLIFSIES